SASEASQQDAAAEDSWWESSLETAQRWSAEAWSSVKQDLSSLVEVRRVDDQAALLVSPDQSERLRDNMRLRVVTARLALLMRQPEVWTAELSMLEKMLSTRFDGNSAQGREAISLVNSLAKTPVAIDLPTLENSVKAIEAQRQQLAANASSSSNNASAIPNEDEDVADTQNIPYPDLVGHTPDAEANESDAPQDSNDDAAPAEQSQEEPVTPEEDAPVEG